MLKPCDICQTPTDNRVVCSNACHIERLRRVRIDPVKSAQARQRISFMTRLALADADVKARASEAQKRRYAR